MKDHWPSIALSEKHLLPDVPGVYCVLSNSGEALYIGKAVSLRNRWRQHHRFPQLIKFQDARVVWHECDELTTPLTRDRWLNDCEAYYLQLLAPPFNNSLLSDLCDFSPVSQEALEDLFEEVAASMEDFAGRLRSLTKP